MQIRMECSGFKWDLTPRGGAHRPNQPLGHWMDPRKPKHDVTTTPSIFTCGVCSLYLTRWNWAQDLFHKGDLPKSSGAEGKSIEGNKQFERCNNIFSRTCRLVSVQSVVYSTTADTLQWLRKTVVFILGVRGHTSTSTLSPGVGSTWSVKTCHLAARRGPKPRSTTAGPFIARRAIVGLLTSASCHRCERWVVLGNHSADSWLIEGHSVSHKGRNQSPGGARLFV